MRHGTARTNCWTTDPLGKYAPISGDIRSSHGNEIIRTEADSSLGTPRVRLEFSKFIASDFTFNRTIQHLKKHSRLFSIGMGVTKHGKVATFLTATCRPVSFGDIVWKRITFHIPEARRGLWIPLVNCLYRHPNRTTHGQTRLRTRLSTRSRCPNPDEEACCALRR